MVTSKGSPVLIKKSFCLVFIGGSKASWIKKVGFNRGGKATIQYAFKPRERFNPTKYVLTYGKNNKRVEGK